MPHLTNLQKSWKNGNYKSFHPQNKMCASELQKCSPEDQNVCIRTTKVCLRRTKCVHRNFKSVHPKNKMSASDLTIKSESYLWQMYIWPTKSVHLINKMVSYLQNVCIRPIQTVWLLIPTYTKCSSVIKNGWNRSTQVGIEPTKCAHPTYSIFWSHLYKMCAFD